MKVFFKSMAGVKSTFNPFNDWLGPPAGDCDASSLHGEPVEP